MRRPVAPVGRKSGGDFRDSEIEQSGFDDHFSGKLHARSLQIQAVDSILTKAAQSALKITHRAIEKQASEPAQTRIAKVAMQERHGQRTYATLETISHDQVIPFVKLVNEVSHLREIVT